MHEGDLISQLKSTPGSSLSPSSSSQNVSIEAEEKSDFLEQIFLDYQTFWNRKIPTDEETVKVNQSLSAAAFFYEKARNVVDNKGEHLLRRNAIERIIRRLVWENPRAEGTKIAMSLVRELVWGRYLENGTISQRQIAVLGTVFGKYFNLLSVLSETNKKTGETKRNLIYGAMSCEVEEILDPGLFYVGTWTRAMNVWFNQSFVWTDEEISEEIKKNLIFVAIHKSLAKSDDARICFHFLCQKFPQWRELRDFSNEECAIALEILGEIPQLLSQPILNRLYRFVRKQTAAFIILRDLIEKRKEAAMEIISDPNVVTGEVVKLCNARYAEIGARVRSGIIRSVIYIFVTKVIIILAIEVPYELLSFSVINWLPLIINLVTPPSLMFLVGLTISQPDAKNTQRIVDKIKEILFQKDRIPVEFSLTIIKNPSLGDLVFRLAYLLLFLVSFSLIVFLLVVLGFSMVSMVVFFFFLSLVLLFGFRVQFAAADLQIEPERKAFFLRAIDSLSLPFLNLGVILSKELGRLNFFAVFMDVLIEMPLKSVIEIAGEWANYMKEKRAEMVEVPMN